ncbi:MAG: hypothetical protein MUC87_19350 [Bacteroidia bacterium]|jgi:hypothetical protein|nr:hypothetical protein [Bacteroidia bacterium]
MQKLLILFFLAPLSVLANDSIPDKTRHHELGINATLLLKQVVNFSPTTLTMLPYQVTYKYITGKRAWRTGIGINISRQSGRVREFNTPVNYYPSRSTYFNTTSLDFRAGYEFQIPIEKRFCGYVGFDAVTSLRNEKSFSVTITDNLPSNFFYNTTSVNEQNISAGGGAVAGFQFFLTKRISLFTETPIYLVWTKSDSQTVSTTDTYFGSGITTQVIRDTSDFAVLDFNIILPVTLYLSMRF